MDARLPHFKSDEVKSPSLVLLARTMRDLERRVVVTGMGVVSCLGHDPDEFYNNLLEASFHL